MNRVSVILFVAFLASCQGLKCHRCFQTEPYTEEIAQAVKDLQIVADEANLGIKIPDYTKNCEGNPPAPAQIAQLTSLQTLQLVSGLTAAATQPRNVTELSKTIFKPQEGIPKASPAAVEQCISFYIKATANKESLSVVYRDGISLPAALMEDGCIDGVDALLKLVESELPNDPGTDVIIATLKSSIQSLETCVCTKEDGCNSKNYNASSFITIGFVTILAPLLAVLYQ